MRSLHRHSNKRLYSNNFLALLCLLYLHNTYGDRTPCISTAECQAAVRQGSECREGFCSNPFESGCLHTLLPDWKKKRVCNSQDPPEAAEQGICRVPDLDYMEIRIFSQNWESVFLEAWILQVLLSEFLDVPTSIETGSPNAQINIYDPQGAFDYGSSNDWYSIGKAAELGDCRLASKEEESYESCAHVVTEVWDSNNAWEMAEEGIAEAPQGLGVLGQEGWFVPKFTGQRDPSLLSYLGLQGEKNRRKVAAAFLTPTTWKDYCKEVSVDQCQTPDDTAQRAPVEDEWENDRMFVEGAYTGHFRNTTESDCDNYPTNCTGHIADYPCGWSSLVTQQAHHLNIPVQSRGSEPGSGGYSYSQLTEIWAAANATKSNVILYWWYPDNLFETFARTDAEFTRINLPNPTQSCVENRVTNTARCSESEQDRIGDPLGACDDAPHPLQKVTSTGLYNMVFDPSIPEALRNPGYDVVKLFSLSGLQLAEIFEYWKRLDDPREGLCQWVVDNKEWGEEFVPVSYPRTLEHGDHSSPLMFAAYSLAGIATLLVLATTVKTYLQRKRRVMIFAQVEFLLLLLLGLLIVSVGAIVNSAPATNASCVATIWLINLGYTLELIPLIVKVSAINRLLNAALGLRRVVLRRTSLFGAVVFINGLVVVFLVLWTTLDPPRKQAEYELTATISEEGDTVVSTNSYCSSHEDVWTFLAIGWNCIMLLCALVLAVQTRNTRQDFNESQTLAMMIYSHTVFLVLRVVIYTVLSGVVTESILAHCETIVFSADTIVTLLIYFVPKFLADNSPRGRRSRSSGNLRWWPSSLVDAQKSYDMSRAFVAAGAIKEGKESADNDTDDAMVSSSFQSSKCPHCGVHIDQQGDERVAFIPEEMEVLTMPEGPKEEEIASPKCCLGDTAIRMGQQSEDASGRKAATSLWSSCGEESIVEA